MHYAEEEMQYHLQIHNRETLNGVKKSPRILNIRF